MSRIFVLAVLIFVSSRATSQVRGLADYGVEVVFDVDKMFPESWFTKEINAKATPVDTSEVERSKAILIKALNKYPVELIKKHLTKVYVAKSLEFYGLSYGGTYSTSVIYITNRGRDTGATDFWIEQTLHSEFSSILFRDFGFLFDKKRFASYNKDINYGQSGTEALRQGRVSKEFDFELNKRGVLALYGTASIEEDFNLFAQNLFLSSTGFWEIGRGQKRIRKKTNQVVAFYNQIDDIFNEEYFREISKK